MRVVSFAKATMKIYIRKEINVFKTIKTIFAYGIILGLNSIFSPNNYHLVLPLQLAIMLCSAHIFKNE